jgi:hypothetical protein
MVQKYSFKISPEVISDDIFQVCYPSGTTYPSGCTYVYSGMSEILSGGTGGTSLLTGLTIPILLTQSAVDVGYYSVFDGAILQTDVVRNFIFSATTSSPNTIYIYNTSEKQLKNYLTFSAYVIDWGDGTAPQNLTTLSPSFTPHLYSTNGTYTITMKQSNPWGVNTIKKTITIPYTGTTISNPNGTAYFTPLGGSWSGTSFSYDYIFSGDAVNNVSAQVTSAYETTPFNITGYTKSRITELKLYGPVKYQINTWVYNSVGLAIGQITNITPDFTGYTVDGVSYVDFKDGTTIYIVKTFGLTSNWMVQEPMTKDEALLNVVFQPDVQSNIFIERGKNSALERTERLGEVDNIGDLRRYGYGFFNFAIQENIN